MPFKFPSLSNNAVVMMSLKLAKGLIEICELLLGVKYGLSGLTITEFAKTVAGGNAKVCHLVLSTKAVAKVVLRVVIAGAGMAYPIRLLGSSA